MTTRREFGHHYISGDEFRRRIMEILGLWQKQDRSTGGLSHLLADLSRYSWAHIISTYWPEILDEDAQ